MKIIGHRGARGLAPENTIAGLKKGMEHHVDILEFDLRVTKDGEVILHHDAALRDAAGQKFKISEHYYKDLKNHKPDLPTLKEVFDEIGQPVPLYIEVKEKEPVKPIAKIIEQYLARGWRPDGLLLGSKNQKTLRELHSALPQIEKIVIERWSGVKATRRARQVNAKRICMYERWLWWGFIKSMKRGGWELYSYPTNDVSKARRWQRYGLSGIVTDFPDRFEK